MEEIEEHIKANKPAMLYFSSAPIPNDADLIQVQALRTFKSEYQPKALCEQYASITDLQTKFTTHLTLTVARYLSNVVARVDPNGSQEVRIHSMSDTAKRLIIEAAKDVKGQVMKTRNKEGISIQTNQHDLVMEKNARNEAKWEAGFEELIELGYLKDRSGKGEIFYVTDSGYTTLENIE